MKKKHLKKRIDYLEMLVADLQTRLIGVEEGQRILETTHAGLSKRVEALELPRLVIETRYDLEGRPVHFVTKTTDNMQGLDALNTLLYNNLERLNSEDDVIEVEIDTEVFRP